MPYILELCGQTVVLDDRDMGRSLAGERVTASETVADITVTALSSVRDAALGALSEVFGTAHGRIGQKCGACGQILEGVGRELTKGQIEGITPNAITHYTQPTGRSTPARALHECPRNG